MVVLNLLSNNCTLNFGLKIPHVRTSKSVTFKTEEIQNLTDDELCTINTFSIKNFIRIVSDGAPVLVLSKDVVESEIIPIEEIEEKEVEELPIVETEIFEDTPVEDSPNTWATPSEVDEESPSQADFSYNGNMED
jgi:hypothetical protein